MTDWMTQKAQLCKIKQCIRWSDKKLRKCTSQNLQENLLTKKDQVHKCISMNSSQIVSLMITSQRWELFLR
jgi:hypothetical protein